MSAETYGTLLGVYEAGERWERVEAVMEATVAAGMPPRMELYGMLIGVYEKGERWERVEAVMEAMRAAGAQVCRHYLHCASFTVSLTESPTVSSSPWSHCIPHCAPMQPGVDTFNSMVAAHGKARRWERMEATVEAMREAGMPPGVDTFNTLLGAYGKGRQWERLDGAMAAMKAAGLKPDVDTYVPLLIQGRGEAQGSGLK